LALEAPQVCLSKEKNKEERKEEDNCNRRIRKKKEEKEKEKKKSTVNFRGHRSGFCGRSCFRSSGCDGRKGLRRHGLWRRCGRSCNIVRNGGLRARSDLRRRYLLLGRTRSRSRLNEIYRTVRTIRERRKKEEKKRKEKEKKKEKKKKKK
jgi:hypothetical protein